VRLTICSLSQTYLELSTCMASMLVDPKAAVMWRLTDCSSLTDLRSSEVRDLDPFAVALGASRGMVSHVCAPSHVK
jgi:hypothetical protein